MIASETNFALYWYVLQGRLERLTENAEFRLYFAAMAAVSALVSGLLFAEVGLAETPSIRPIAGSLEVSVRHGVFQAVVIVTTTGYARGVLSVRQTLHVLS